MDVIDALCGVGGFSARDREFIAMAKGRAKADGAC